MNYGFIILDGVCMHLYLKCYIFYVIPYIKLHGFLLCLQ